MQQPQRRHSPPSSLHHLICTLAAMSCLATTIERMQQPPSTTEPFISHNTTSPDCWPHPISPRYCSNVYLRAFFLFHGRMQHPRRSHSSPLVLLLLGLEPPAPPARSGGKLARRRAGPAPRPSRPRVAQICALSSVPGPACSSSSRKTCTTPFAPSPCRPTPPPRLAPSVPPWRTAAPPTSTCRLSA